MVREWQNPNINKLTQQLRILLLSVSLRKDDVHRIFPFGLPFAMNKPDPFIHQTIFLILAHSFIVFLWHPWSNVMSTVCAFMFNSTIHPNGSFSWVFLHWPLRNDISSSLLFQSMVNLRSPNWPGLYPRDTECYYFFYGQSNEKIHITFAYFVSVSYIFSRFKH